MKEKLIDASRLARLSELYHISKSTILNKVYQIAPWKSFQFAWKHYGEAFFPMKLICHFSLVVLLTIIICYDNYQWGNYNRAASVVSCGFFLPSYTDQCSYEQCVGYLLNRQPSLESYTCSIYKNRVLKAAIIEAVEKYNNINETSIGQFQHPSILSDETCVTSQNNILKTGNFRIYFTNQSFHEYPLDPPVISTALDGILAKNAVKKLLYFKLTFPLADQFATDIYHANYYWEFHIQYLYINQVYFQVKYSNHIQSICHIQTPSIHSGNLFSTDDQTNVVIYSYEYMIATLVIVALICSVIYGAILLQEMLYNIRLVFLIGDILTTVESTSTPSATSNEMPRRSYADTTGQRREEKTTFSDGYSFVISIIRYLLWIPPMNDASIASIFPLQERSRKAPEELYCAKDKKDQSMATEEDSTENHSPEEQSTLEDTNITKPISTNPPTERASLFINDSRARLSDWQHLSIKIKMRLFDGWRNLSIIGTFIAFYICIQFLDIQAGNYCTILNYTTKQSSQSLTSLYLEDYARLLLAISAALQWFTLLQYWRYSNRYTISSLILWGAFFKIQRVIISILPIGIGLIFVGIVLFGNSSLPFNNVKNIIITIYSVMNCDSIWDTFTATNSDENFPIIGTIYVSLIFIIFHYLTLRVILAIVETLYFYLKLFMNAQAKRQYYRKQRLQLIQERTGNGGDQGSGGTRRAGSRMNSNASSKKPRSEEKNQEKKKEKKKTMKVSSSTAQERDEAPVDTRMTDEKIFLTTENIPSHRPSPITSPSTIPPISIHATRSFASRIHSTSTLDSRAQSLMYLSPPSASVDTSQPPSRQPSYDFTFEEPIFDTTPLPPPAPLLQQQQQSQQILELQDVREDGPRIQQKSAQPRSSVLPFPKLFSSITTGATTSTADAGEGELESVSSDSSDEEDEEDEDGNESTSYSIFSGLFRGAQIPSAQYTVLPSVSTTSQSLSPLEQQQQKQHSLNKKVRLHSSELIQRSLFSIYTQYLREQTSRKQQRARDDDQSTVMNGMS